MWARLPLALLMVGCADLEPPQTSLNCVSCVPMCAAGPLVDLDDFAGSARRLGCDPELVSQVWPRPGELTRERRPAIGVELARTPLGDAVHGEGCQGAISLSRLGRVGEIPGAVGVDIVARASLTTLPVWPATRECVPGRWTRQGSTLEFEPATPLEPFVWYEVVVDQALEFEGDGLCSELSWRFAVEPCGNGEIERASSFSDWVCLGRVEAEQGYFEPYEETCDDGNQLSGDACSAFCLTETGWHCDADGCETRCGDGIVVADEECDGGLTGRPGCDADCHTLPGFRCDAYSCWELGPEKTMR